MNRIGLVITAVVAPVIIAVVMSLFTDFAYAYEGESKWGDMLIKKCVLYNASYSHMLII